MIIIFQNVYETNFNKRHYCFVSAPSGNCWFRIRLDIGVAYGTDLDMVEDLLLLVADENNQVVKQPPPRVRLRNCGDSAVNFQLLLWIRDPREKGRQTHLLLKEVYRVFNENKVSIPFPQRDVYIREQGARNREKRGQ